MGDKHGGQYRFLGARRGQGMQRHGAGSEPASQERRTSRHFVHGEPAGEGVDRGVRVLGQGARGGRGQNGPG
eukprot:7915903-Pyramimonas_sp.AAC.1